MQVITAAIPDIKIIVPSKHEDARGFLCETYNSHMWVEHGITTNFVQDNQSYSKAAYTLRGLHYQAPPEAQVKLVHVVRGAALDFAVDIRKNSATYGHYVVVELRADLLNQILIPEGFAHGILTLEPNTELLYKISRHFNPKLDKGILWSDPAIGIELPVAAERLTLSERDKNLPLLKDVVM